ncbi:MAG: IS701 family transposase [Symploca sp. SIO2C1]|nr:IS701 family transposase [Symploca sp. SIO2C1]
MNVELQVLKHLARAPQPTASVIDGYCQSYKDLFKEVRNYECFKYLHLGLVSPIKRKSLPEIAKVVGIKSAQSLHHFIANSPWSVKELKKRRLEKIKKILSGVAITVIIDETGDRKKGKKTDYVARQYLGSIGKIDNGIVSVNAYGVYQNITFPLVVKIFKPRGTLKPEEHYKTKIELASEIIEELIGQGWKSVLNNLRLLIQPLMMLWLILPWLDILHNRKLLLGLNQLISDINQFQPFFSSG